MSDVAKLVEQLLEHREKWRGAIAFAGKVASDDGRTDSSHWDAELYAFDGIFDELEGMAPPVVRENRTTGIKPDLSGLDVFVTSKKYSVRRIAERNAVGKGTTNRHGGFTVAITGAAYYANAFRGEEPVYSIPLCVSASPGDNLTLERVDL